MKRSAYFDCQIMTSATKLWLKHLKLPQTAAAPPASPLSSVNIRSSGHFILHCFDILFIDVFVIFSLYLKDTSLYFIAKKKSYFGKTFEKQYRPINFGKIWHKMVNLKKIRMCKRKKINMGRVPLLESFTVYGWNYS